MNISGPAAVAKPEMLFYAPGDLTVTIFPSSKMIKKFGFLERKQEGSILTFRSTIL